MEGLGQLKHEFDVNNSKIRDVESPIRRLRLRLRLQANFTDSDSDSTDSDSGDSDSMTSTPNMIFIKINLLGVNHIKLK